MKANTWGTIFLKSTSMTVMLLGILLVQSCVQSPSAGRKSVLKSSSNSNGNGAETKIPVFSEGTSFIQNGGVVYTSSVNFDLSFSDTMQLRGKDVDAYIRNNGTQVISCLTARFTADTVKQINIIAAVPHSVYNFTTQTLEYYYRIAPSDETTNRNFCQKTGLINKLLELYSSPALTQVYKIGALCPSGVCISSTYISQPLELYSQSGSPLTQILTKQLSYTITNRPNITTPIGNSCVSNAECQSQGYNCCSLGQCVKDLALKPNVPTNSPDYQQALQDILNNPSHIYLYPQYYFICSTPTNTPTSPTAPGNPTNEAAVRLKNLQDLYNCTTKIEGEMGICTKTYTNAATGEDKFYYAGKDDRNFSTTYTNQPMTGHTPPEKEDLIGIQEITYGEVTLFNYDQIANDSTVRPDPYILTSNGTKYLTINGLHNDDTSSAAKITVHQKPPGAISSDLVIKYKVDASCTQINSSLGKCEKYYIQGQKKSGDTTALNRRGRVTDHFPASNFFKLTTYASLDKTIKVEVDGVIARQDIDWRLNTSSVPASIEFFPSSTGGLGVFDTQKVKISYFVNLSNNHIMDSKLEALQKIQTACHCADLNCGLRPVTNTAGAIIDYACVYPDPNPVIPPMSQKIYLSSKTVPVRYFDTTGTSKATVTGETFPQEGKPFSYRKDNLLNPANVPDILNPVVGEDTYIGFNEIYGSLSYSNNSAKPAKEVAVTKGKTYDIYVDNGSYSNCVQCGNDYYSQLNKLFPLTQFGGGAVPFQSTTNRNQSNGIRADEMSFGRACYVPATMIPWSHSITSDPQTQRLNRMRAQHFLYANGYQHDWYGFDYGSIIGSFDGVKWFSIGSNRRIKADSNKLFIAVNGLFGDLALENTYTVTINDGSLNPVGANMITSDFDSDGAQCQKFHQCSTDNDCATTLGWDYACATVNEATTSWPMFDDNAKEIPDSQRSDNRLTSILGISSTGKRCVYRGRGAACSQTFPIIINSTFNQTTDQTQHVCSSNNYCQSISTNGVPNPKFNNRISRYGKVRTDATSDTFGLAAKVPGRPLEFHAVEQIRSENTKNFSSNRLAAICIPGRSPELPNFGAQNSTAPSSEYTGDKVLGIGMTYRKGESSPILTYLASCGITDYTNNFIHAKGTLTSANSSNSELIWNSGTQAISTNALKLFLEIFERKDIALKVYTNNITPLTSPTFTENRCMRAPGASCFSDLDCAPSKLIADKIKMLSVEDTDVINFINKYEVKFWQEELVCSQSTPKTRADYSPFNNRCCREVGKTISIASSDSDLPILNSSAPGIDINMASKYRYSRTATVYKDQKLDPINYPRLSVAKNDQCNGTCIDISTLTNQFKTFSAYAERTSCSGDWIRNFDNGNHKWESSRFQTFNTTMFKCMNWLPGDYNFTCANMEQDDPECKLIQTLPSSSKAKAIMSFLGRLELTGIPQIAIESHDFYNTTADTDLSCRSFPNNQNACYPGHPDPTNCTPFSVGPQTANLATYAYPNLIYNYSNNAHPVAEYRYTNPVTNFQHKLYSAADVSSFQSMKKIFKADEVVSCLPAGTTMAVGADANLCCTGFINAQNNKCQLPDFVDVSVYTNRYVSSEAKKLNLNLFDAYGYIKDPSYVVQLACEKKMCASGVLAYGVLISNLKTPGQEAIDQKHLRFIQGHPASDDANGLLTLYTKGLKLNSHAYCLPSGSTTAGSDDLTIISCAN